MTTKKSTPKINFSKMCPYGLQKIIMEHKARFKVVAFGRQSGKSWLAKRVLLEKAANEGKRCWWVAPSIPTAMDHWEDLVTLIEKSGFPVKDINKSHKQINFISGGSIRVRSAEKPNNLRGGTLDFIVLDEAAFMADSLWFKILQPMITASRGEVMFLSTPNGQNWFYTVFRLGLHDSYADFASWHMPSTEAPYQDHAMLEIIRQTVPAMVWREEYMAEFLADAGGVFVGLDRVAYRPMLTAPKKGHIYVAGVDWGMDDDFTVFSVADRYTCEQVYLERFNSIGTTAQAERIIDLLSLWQPEVCHIERNGVGAPLLGLLRDLWNDRTNGDELSSTEGNGLRASEWIGLGGKTKIRAVTVNNEKKRRMIERYSAAIEWGRFSPLVREDETDMNSPGAIQISEMSTFKRKRTQSGLEITYGAAEGCHDDTISAGALMFMGIPDGQLRERDDTTVTPLAVKPHVPKVVKRSPFQARTTRRTRSA